jgi:large subunit ribosomal protein L10e
MGGLRPAKCYRKLERPYTRQSMRKPKKGYVKGVPDPKIHRFEMGNKEKNFPLKGELIVKSSVQVRSNALEAARISCHKYLTKNLGEEGYFMKVLVYPHHVLRENPLATGAGADRFQTGMRMSFGKTIGTAAQVREGQRIIQVGAEKGKEAVVKEALKRAGAKIPSKCRVAFSN